MGLINVLDLQNQTGIQMHFTSSYFSNFEHYLSMTPELAATRECLWKLLTDDDFSRTECGWEIVQF
jgi:hypothetical protein